MGRARLIFLHQKEKALGCSYVKNVKMKDLILITLRLRTLRTFINWYIDKEYIDTIPRINGKKVFFDTVKKVPKVLTKKEFLALKNGLLFE